MKIGFVYSRRNSNEPWKAGDGVCFGPFVQAEDKPNFCPRIYFEFPILRPVSAVVWSAPTVSGNYISMQIFNWSACENLGEIKEYAGEISGSLPQYAQIDENPSRELRKLLKCAKEYWEPFTSLEAAPKLISALLEMSDLERNDFMEKLGQSRNPRTMRVRRERFFIAHRWHAWEQDEVSYDVRCKDMEKHGFKITLDAFKKRVGKREMNLHRLYRE